MQVMTKAALVAGAGAVGGIAVGETVPAPASGAIVIGGTIAAGLVHARGGSIAMKASSEMWSKARALSEVAERKGDFAVAAKAMQTPWKAFPELQAQARAGYELSAMGAAGALGIPLGGLLVYTGYSPSISG